MLKITPDQDDALLVKINAAVKAMNEAQAEHVSRSKAVGLLLLEAKRLHPKVKDFEAYLKRVDGLGLSRAYDLLRLAGGRVTDEELKRDARQRQQRTRDRRVKSKTVPPPAPEPKQPEVSVTSRKEGSGENARAEGADAVSARCLQAFEEACQRYLPQLSAADLRKAQDYFTMQDGKKQKEAA